MNKTLQQLADRWEAIAEEWRDILTSRKETYITCAAELREVLSHCNLTAEVPTWQELEAIHDKAWKEGGFGYDRSKAGWEAVINALVPHIPATADADAKPSSFDEWLKDQKNLSPLKDKGAWDDDRTYFAHEGWQACEKWMQAKVEELENWKRQQLEVEAQLDAQRLSKLLGAKLGESCHAAINREVPKLVEEARLWHQRYDEQTHTAAYTAQQRDEALNEVERLRAELETLRWRDVSVKPTREDADDSEYIVLLCRKDDSKRVISEVHWNAMGFIDPSCRKSEWLAWRPASLPRETDPFTAWRQRYMPNSSDDLAREAWEKAKGN